jgi:hypothetical protein
VAMIDMLQDIHSAVSVPQLVDTDGTTPWPAPSPGASPSPAPGVSFQLWSSGPHKLKNDVNVGDTKIHLVLTANAGPTPIAGQRLIIPAYQIEADISAVQGNSGDFQPTLTNISGPVVVPSVTYPTSTIPVAIKGTGSSGGDVVCFITDRCSYAVSNSNLNWRWKGNTKAVANYVTNSTPFSSPTTPAGALYTRFVAAIDLSTSDTQYSNRGYKSANILLNGQIPFKTRLTTYQ